jgi:hypothetical protein
MNKFPEPVEEVISPSQTTEAQALAELAYLWKLDDPAWVVQRDLDWELMLDPFFHDYPKAELKKVERYFKYGEKNEYISIREFFFLTPYNSIESIRQLFYSSLLSKEGRREILQSYIYIYNEREICPWYEAHMSYAIAGLLGDSYRVIKEQTSSRHSDLISPDPTVWCKDFVLYAIDSLTENAKWKPIYDCVNYFVTALPYATREKQRKRMELFDLMKLIEKSLEEGLLTCRALVFAKELKSREADIKAAWEIGEQKILLGEIE